MDGNDADVRTAKVRALVFDAQGRDREVPLESLDPSQLGEHALAWIDVHAVDRHDVERVFETLALDVPAIAPLFDNDELALSTRGDWFATRAVAPHWNGAELRLGRAPWLLVVGPNLVLTARKVRLRFLESYREWHDPHSRVGELDSDSFAVVLLDRMLTAYFDAMDAFEDQVDKLEVEILEDRLHHGHVPRLRKLRRAAARFRQLLSFHRDLFDALRRPDFRPQTDARVEARFRAVADRYERAMDATENARELVVGSYELLNTRLSQKTNDTMRVLTFATVLLGGLAVLAGVLGMNFQAGIFNSGSDGFWTTVAAMTVLVVVALVVAWRRGWLR